MRFHQERLIERPVLDYCDSNPLACSFIGTALAIGLAAASAAGSIGGAAIASSGANKAANTAASSSEYAANLEKQAADQALAEQRRQFDTNQSNLAPWLTAGRGALSELSTRLGISGTSGPNNTWQVGPDGNPIAAGATASVPTNFGSLLQPFGEQFQAPTSVTEQNDPGYQFRIQQGLDAIQRSAAAKGNILTGGTAKDLNDYAQNQASSEYGNVYNRAFNQYAERYNQFENDQTNTYNRLGSLAGLGQQTASQLGTLGQSSANNISNILTTSAGQIGNDFQNAGAARASGYANSGNIYGNSLSSLGNLPLSLYALSQIGKH